MNNDYVYDYTKVESSNEYDEINKISTTYLKCYLSKPVTISLQLSDFEEIKDVINREIENLDIELRKYQYDYWINKLQSELENMNNHSLSLRSTSELKFVYKIQNKLQKLIDYVNSLKEPEQKNKTIDNISFEKPNNRCFIFAFLKTLKQLPENKNETDNCLKDLNKICFDIGYKKEIKLESFRKEVWNYKNYIINNNYNIDGSKVDRQLINDYYSFLSKYKP
jgi:hypothetical protein